MPTSSSTTGPSASKTSWRPTTRRHSSCPFLHPSIADANCEDTSGGTRTRSTLRRGLQHSTRGASTHTWQDGHYPRWSRYGPILPVLGDALRRRPRHGGRGVARSWAAPAGRRPLPHRDSFIILNHDSYHELGRAAGSAPSSRRPRWRGCAPGWTSPRFGVEQRCSSSDVARRGSREIAEIQPRFSRDSAEQARFR